MSGRGGSPSHEAYREAAVRLGCEEAAVRAVATVEAGPLGAFFATGEPVILFERHWFHRLTDGRHAGARASGLPASCSLLSSAKRGGYGPYSAQHKRLAAAAALDREAALKSASWGLFQIMGCNFWQAGHSSLQSFVNAMYRGVDDHLAAFVAYVLADPRLVRAIRRIGSGGEVTFARIYNGPAYAENAYDARILRAFLDFQRKSA